MSKQTIEAYNRRASRYEQKWEHYLDHTHHKFLERIETSPTDTLLDLSGGTGLLAEELITGNYLFQQLIVNEPSKSMLKIARDRLPDRAFISFTNRKAYKISFENQSVDAIFCLNAFHFYPHQQETLEALYRILKPNGRLYLLDWNRAGLFRVINRIIDWFSPDYIDTRSLDELVEMMTRSSFQISSCEEWSWRYWKFFFAEAQK